VLADGGDEGRGAIGNGDKQVHLIFLQKNSGTYGGIISIAEAGSVDV
jgi:hypothetical protein